MNLKKFFTNHWLLITILLVASFFRLYRISEYAEFLGDQGRDVVIIRDFLKNGNLFFIGPQTSIGNMYLGPYFYYFIAPSLLFSFFHPVGPAIFIALLGILTVYLVFIISLRWFDVKTAYLSSFLFTISPIVIKYSTFSWNPNIMPLFSLLFIYFLAQKKYLLASLAFIMCLNSHYLGLLLIFPAIFILIFQYRRRDLRSILLAIGLFVLSLTPQLLFDLKHQGQNINALTTFFTQRETTVNLKPYKALPKLPELFNQVITRLLTAKNEILGLTISILVFVLIIIQIRQNKFKIKSHFYFYLSLIWLLSGLVGLALYKQHIYDHYFGFLYPVIFILAGFLLTRLKSFLLVPLTIVLTGFSLYQNPHNFPPPRQIQVTEEIINSIATQSQGQPFNFALLAKMNYDPGYLYFIYQKNLPYFHLNQQITNQLFVVCEPFQIDCNPINNPEWGIAAFGWAKIDFQWQINGINIYRLVPNPQGKP